MGFISLFCLSQPVCLLLLRANAARTQTSTHVISYVTRLHSPLLYPFVVLCDLKPLQFSALFAWGPPYTGGPGQTAPVAPPCRRHCRKDIPVHMMISVCEHIQTQRRLIGMMHAGLQLVLRDELPLSHFTAPLQANKNTTLRNGSVV